MANKSEITAIEQMGHPSSAIDTNHQRINIDDTVLVINGKRDGQTGVVTMIYAGEPKPYDVRFDDGITETYERAELILVMYKNGRIPQEVVNAAIESMSEISRQLIEARLRNNGNNEHTLQHTGGQIKI